MKLRKKIISLLLLGTMAFALAGCAGKMEGTGEPDIDTVTIDGNPVVLEAEASVYASVWNEPEYEYNGESLEEAPVLYKGITIGSDLTTVLETFGIEEGYAMVDREVSTPEHDGTTEMICQTYHGTDFFEEEDVLDAVLSFGYKKTKDTWELVAAEDLEAEADIVYSIDFVGGALAADASVDEKQVISCSVRRVK